MRRAGTLTPGISGLGLPRWLAVMVVGAILLAGGVSSSALDPSLDISQYAHTAWRVRDGFTRGSIYSIAQTPDGYLWLGTEFGLFRFDGVRLTPWQPPAGERLPDEFVTAVLAARDGTLWIGTRTGLASWKSGKLMTHPEMADEQIHRLVEDHDGTIWVGTIRTPYQAKLCAFHTGAVECHGGDGSLGSEVVGLYEDNKANLWVGVVAGFWHWKPGPPKFFSAPSDPNGVRGLAEDDQGALLVSLSTGMGRFAGGRIETDVLPGLKPPPGANCMLRDRDGGLWIGTFGRGIIHVHRGRIDSFSDADGLSSDTILGIFEDREGDIWAATADGLDRFRPYSVSTLSVKQGLSASLTGAALAARDGSVWIQTLSGLDRWQQGKFSPVVLQEAGKPGRMLHGLTPNSLFEDSSGHIWVSTNREFGFLDQSRYVTVSDYPGGYVHGIVEGPPGHLWVASQQAGLLHVFQRKVIEQFPWSRLGHEDAAIAMALDPRGGLWLGFIRGGITYFADGALRAVYSAAANGLGAGAVNELRFGSQGALFAATEGGLSRIKDGHIATLTSRNGLPCDAVYWTVRDDNGSVWLYTRCGLLRIAQAEWDAWAADPAKTVKPAVFDATDGIRTRAAAGGYKPQVTKSPDGRLWFVTGDGVSVLDPRHLVSNQLAPPVHIEQVIADGKAYDPAQGQRLPPLVRDLAIDYTALSLVAPEKIHFRFKLEGQDKDWREVVNDRRAYYTNLRPRHYRFRMRAANNSGVWNEVGDSLDFSIAPAYYQTAWFLGLCVIAFLALLYAFYRVRMWQEVRHFNMRLEERVRERTRIARELHDTLLQSFQGVMLKLYSVTNILDRPVQARERLEALLEQGQQAITEGREAVQGIRSSTLIKNDLAAALGTLGEGLAAEEHVQSPVDFRVAVEGNTRDLHPIMRDEMYRIASEALRNAFRHSGAERIEVEIYYDDRQLRVRVIDNGKGMDEKVLDRGGREGHFGLPGMHERAKLAGGRLSIWSKLDSGTAVELTIPASRAYLKSSPPRPS